MGYYTRADLDFYYALADAFTICDHYHCSVIGPTDPNRLYSMAGSLDPAGKASGPILSTSGTRVDRFGTLTYTTMPERRRAGRSPAHATATTAARAARSAAANGTRAHREPLGPAQRPARAPLSVPARS